jgi:hypothetical protein
MYGDGLYAQDEGHLGGRYFVDANRRVTLHVEIGVDRYIESVEYRRGVHLPASYQKSGVIPKQAISARLTQNELLQGGIHLGAKPDTLIQQFGKPKQETRKGAARTIRYNADYQTMPYVLYYEAEFRFQNNQLVSISLYNGD